MNVVEEWTGRHAAALRRASRMTNEGFADRLGTAMRTVAKWNAEPAMVPTLEMQRALDTLLTQSSDDVRARFFLLLAEQGPGPEPATVAAESRLTVDRNIAAATDWLDRATRWPAGTARTRAAARWDEADLRSLQDRGRRRNRVPQREIAEALCAYYGRSDKYRPYSARTESGSLATSIMTRPDWLDLRLPLGTELDGLRFTPVAEKVPEIDSTAAAARGPAPSRG